MTFWDFCDRHIVLTGFALFALIPPALLLVYALGAFWYNAHRNGVIAKLAATKTKEAK